MPRKNALSRAKSSIVTDSLRITQSSGLDHLSGYPDNRSGAMNGMTMRRSEADMPSALCSGSTALATRTQ